MYDNSELSCQNFYNGSQWGVYDFTMLEIGDYFGINTDLRIDPNSIPHTGKNNSYNISSVTRLSKLPQ